MSKLEFPTTDHFTGIYSIFALPRTDVEAELKGSEFKLAPNDELEKVGWSKGEDSYPVCLQFQKNTNVGPIVGHVGHVNHNILRFIVPWLSFPDHKGWAFRPLGLTDTLVAVLLARGGFYEKFRNCQKITYETGDTSVKYFNKDKLFDAEWKTEEKYQALSDMKKDTTDLFALATLNQFWTGDLALKVGGAYQLDPTKMQVRHLTLSALEIKGKGYHLGPLFTTTSSVVHFECKTVLHESHPTPIADLVVKPEPEGVLAKVGHGIGDVVHAVVDTVDGLKGSVDGVLSLVDKLGEPDLSDEKKKIALFEAKTGGDIPKDWFASSFKPTFQYITLFQKIRENKITTEPVALKPDIDIVAAVQTKITEGRTVAITGTGYGGTFAESSVPLNMSGLLGTPHLGDIVESKVDPTLIKIGSGVCFQDLADKFWPADLRKWDADYSKCRCVVATTGYDYLNVIGTGLSGAIGCGTQTPPIHGTIRALEVVYAKTGTDGKKTATRAWIQPADAKLPADLVDDKVEVISDNDAFDAWKCSFGQMGLITNAVIEMEPAFWLEEKRNLYSWKEAQPLITSYLKQNDAGEIYNVEVWVSPYNLWLWSKWDDCPVLLSVRTRKTPDAKNTSGHRGFGLTVPLDVAILTGEMSKAAANHARGLLPAVMWSALSSCEQDPVVLTALESRYFGSSNGVPVGVTGSILPVDDVSKFLGVVSGYIQGLQKRFKDKKGLITSPFSLRFSQGSTGLLAPQFGKFTHCLLEQPIISGTDDIEDTLAFTEDYLSKNGGGRPHWGLQHHMDKTRLAELYPAENVSKFKKELAKFSNGVFQSKQSNLFD